jgi:hypothetical protein
MSPLRPPIAAFSRFRRPRRAPAVAKKTAATLPAPKKWLSRSGETVDSPLGRLKVFSDGPVLWVEIASDLVVDPGGRYEPFLRLSGEAVRFDRVDDRFVLVGRPAP